MFDQEQTAVAAYVALLEVVDDALCAQVDTDLFFPHKGESPRQAKALCFGCPIRTQCLEYACAAGETGVWGGTSENDRRRMGVNRRYRAGGWDTSAAAAARRRQRAAQAQRLELERAGSESREQLVHDLERERLAS